VSKGSLLRNSRSDCSTERGHRGIRASLYLTCSACQAKNATKMTNYAFSDNLMQRRRLLAILQEFALNTRVHLQRATTYVNFDTGRARSLV
jgi:hypothetical protein